MKLYIIIGAYGSGKSEYSIHLARSLKARGETVSLVDMDVVNPYFRTRDVREVFAQEGIEVIAPEGHFSHADLPMISPRIMGAIQNSNRTVILDVGGDPAGCRTLGRFLDPINHRGYHLQLVVNTSRPFTANPEEISAMITMLESASKMKVNELICNTNLMEHTNQELVEDGIRMVDEAAKAHGLAFDTYLVLDEYADIVSDGILGKKRLVLNYTLKKPWERLVMKGI
jgi:tRNA uridine 5-carbamoylmethylation protein Kti12